MDLVFEVPIEKKVELKKLLEADPYGEKSFSRNGYKLKDGAAVGADEKKAYLFMKATGEFAAFAREKLKEIAAESKKEDAEKVVKKIGEEESSAEVGFGSIFGE